MGKQEAKIEYMRENKLREVFFFAHDFKSAYQHAEAYIERNKAKMDMKLFVLNSSSFGPKWRLDRVVKQN